MNQALAQWIMALATLTTAVVVAVQSFSISKTLNSQFAGNLQNREILVCENSVIAVKLSSDVIREYLTIVPRSTLADISDAELEIATSRFPISVGDGFAEHEAVLADTRAQLALLKFYASNDLAVIIADMDGGIDRIQDMISVAATLRNTANSGNDYDWMETEQPNPKSQPRAWLLEIYAASDMFFTGIIDVNNRCAEIVLGKRRGLI
ncbi:MAG: hypothetical protein COB08_013460 [Rhodobacteraceae bacterium]|nr:hypothetical protein [Paracoccaceae bacterium]